MRLMTPAGRLASAGAWLCIAVVFKRPFSLTSTGKSRRDLRACHRDVETSSETPSALTNQIAGEVNDDAAIRIAFRNSVAELG
jgi:hypothetical protein